MKKNYLLLLLLLFMFRASGQNCNFSYQTNPGTTVVSFTPNANYSPNLYRFVWSFGDGTADSTVAPTHTYNGAGPYFPCYDIYDLSGNIVCTACDSIYLGTIINCMFTYNNLGSTFTFAAINSLGGFVTWDFGDGGTGVGSTASHTYLFGGPHTVVMSVIDTMNGNILCQFNQGIIAPGSSPNCNFTAVVQGNSVTLVAGNVSPNTLVSWDFGDGFVGTGYQVTHLYTVDGIYNVCMSATDTNGVSCTSCQSVTIITSSGNCFYTYFPDSINLNTLYFSAVPAYPFSTILWDFGDGSAIDTGSFVSHSFNGFGPYTVCMKELDSIGGVLCIDCQTVILHNVPNCSFSSYPGILNPLAINFQANGGTSAITWDFGDGTSDTGVSVNHTYSFPGIYQVCMTVGIGGTTTFCTSCDYVAVGNPINYCSINYFPDPLSQNTFVFTSSQSSSSSMILWDMGDGTTALGQSVSHTYQSAGVYTVCVIERDSIQNILCQNCVTIQVGGNTTICQAGFLSTSFGLDAYFIDMSIASGPYVQYSWDFGDNTISNLQFPQHTYSTPGLYNVCLTVTDSLCSDMFCAPILVDTGAMNPGGGCNAFFAFVQLTAYQVTVVNLSSGLNLSYDWDFGDGSPHDYTPYPSHFYNSTGTYNLCLTITDGAGCTSTYCDTLNVDTLGNIYRMASQGFTINVLSPAMITGVNDVADDNSFSVYPNPFTSEIRISLSNGSKRAGQYRVFSVQGAEVLRGYPETTGGIINTQSLSPGVYLLEITMSDGARSFQRVIKN